MPAWLLTLLGGGDGPLAKVVDKALAFIPDPAQREKFLVEMREMDWTELKAQLDIDALEANSEKWWKAGWRPAFGWICAFGFGTKFVAIPLFTFVVLCFNSQWAGIHNLPQIDWTELSALALPLLGISRDRSNEKQALIAAKK